MSTPLAKYTKHQKKKFQEYVEKNIDKLSPFEWYHWISRVPHIDTDFILKHKDKRWSRTHISMNTGISKEDKFRTRDVIDWDFSFIVDTIEEYKELGLTCSFIFSHRDKHIVEDVEKFPEFDWDWYSISSNSNITPEFILKYHAEMDIDMLGSNPAVKIEFAYENRHIIDWNLYGLSENPNITPENFRLFDFDMTNYTTVNNLSEKLPVNYILSHPEIPWNTELVCLRDDITVKHIIEHPDFSWNFEVLSHSRCLDKNWFKKQPNANLEAFYRYNWSLSIDDVFELEPSQIEGNLLLGTLEEKMDYMRKYNAVKTIGNAFYMCYWFTDYAYCRKRLNKRYDELFGETTFS